METSRTDVGLVLSPAAVDEIVRLCMDSPYRFAAPIIKILGEARQQQEMRETP
jgi:hypothetical protein